MTDDLIARYRNALRDQARDHDIALEQQAARIAALEGALRTIRDATHKSAVVLRGIADAALSGEQPAKAEPKWPTKDVWAALDLDPERFTTEAGFINQGKLRAAILWPGEYVKPNHWLLAQQPASHVLVPRKITPEIALAIENADMPTGGGLSLVDLWQPSWDAAIAAAGSQP